MKTLIKNVMTVTAMLLVVAQVFAATPICTNDRVISDSGLIGTATGIYPNGNISVKFDGIEDYYEWPQARLARTSGCSSDNGKYCVGRKVQSDTGLGGKIEGVFPNGNVAVKFTRYDGYYIWPVSRLALSSTCTASRCEQ
jgi:hypothetical protein